MNLASLPIDCSTTHTMIVVIRTRAFHGWHVVSSCRYTAREHGKQSQALSNTTLQSRIGAKRLYTARISTSNFHSSAVGHALS